MTWQSLGPWRGHPATVYPLNDLRDHVPDDPNCWCRPAWDEGILVHNAMDRREEYEEGRLLS